VAEAVAVAAIWPVPLENQLTIGNKFSLYHVLSLREAVTKCLYVWDENQGLGLHCQNVSCDSAV
jgi:hypothetical protein